MFQPVLPSTGYVGWKFLSQTLDRQQETFAQSSRVKRATENFAEKIGAIKTAADLVDDRELLSVALGAFGLSEDINNKFFIRKVLSDGTSSNTALANRLSDQRYRSMSAAFGFGDGGSKTALSGFAQDIISKYEDRQFEAAVGEQNNDLRLALNVESSLSEVVSGNAGQNAQWFALMGNPPLRNVMQTALGLPSSVAQIDVDQQLTLFKERASSVFGADRVDELTSPESQEKLIRLFLIRSEAQNNSGLSGASTALTLLQSARRF